MSAAAVAPARALTRDELDAWGTAFGAALAAPCVVALSGEVGAGKTTLVQAIARGCGVVESVTSPTYTLVHEYRASRAPVLHLDLYRLSSEAALDSIGFDEIVASEAVVLIEWAERAGDRLPRHATRLALAHDPADLSRRLLQEG